MKIKLLLFLSLFCIFVQSQSKTCDITNYGAKGDGKTDNTKSIQAAINDCINNGMVTVPSGSFLTYPLTINAGKTFVFLVSSNAYLVAGSIDNWPVSDSTYVDFMTFTNCQNCSLTGSGIIDGGGTPWYIAFDQGQLKYKRPHFIVANHCTNFQVSALHILNTPAWGIVMDHTIGIVIANINITDQWYDNETKEPHNTDGIDVGQGCQNVHIHDSYISNGDDCVAVEPGSNNICTSNVLVENCYFSKGHGASIGSVGAGCVENVVFRNITMDTLMNGCNLKTYNKGPGFVKNITWDNIVMSNTGHCLNINTNYQPGTGPAQIKISDIVMSNIEGTGCKYPATFTCQSSLPCEGISLKNVNVAKGVKNPVMTCAYAHGTATNVQPTSCLET